MSPHRDHLGSDEKFGKGGGRGGQKKSKRKKGKKSSTTGSKQRCERHIAQQENKITVTKGRSAGGWETNPPSQNLSGGGEKNGVAKRERKEAVVNRGGYKRPNVGLLTRLTGAARWGRRQQKTEEIWGHFCKRPGKKNGRVSRLSKKNKKKKNRCREKRKEENRELLCCHMKRGGKKTGNPKKGQTVRVSRVKKKRKAKAGSPSPSGDVCKARQNCRSGRQTGTGLWRGNQGKKKKGGNVKK